jgi:hypothetical protein
VIKKARDLLTLWNSNNNVTSCTSSDNTCFDDQGVHDRPDHGDKEIVTLSHKHEKTKTEQDCWNLALQQKLCEANGIPMCNTGPSPLSHNCTTAVLTSSGSNHAQLKGAVQCDHGGIQKR